MDVTGIGDLMQNGLMQHREGPAPTFLHQFHQRTLSCSSINAKIMDCRNGHTYQRSATNMPAGDLPDTESTKGRDVSLYSRSARRADGRYENSRTW